MQQDTQVAKRYAKSLLNFAIERNELDAVSADMKLIAQTCENSKDLRLMLKSPLIKSEQKLAIIQKIFSGEIGSISMNFLKVVAQKERENILPEISRAFGSVYNQHMGIVSAEITSAIPLSESERQRAVEVIKHLGDKVELNEKIDKNIIGGFIIRVGDKQYDASVSSRIKAIKRDFSRKNLQ